MQSARRGARLQRHVRNDGEIVQAILSGRTERFAELVDRHAPAVFRLQCAARDAEKMVAQLARSRRFDEIKKAANAADDLRSKAEAYLKEFERTQRCR